MNTNTVIAITDEQIAELESHCQKFHGFAITSQMVMQMIARLREAEKDAARWRYARDILTVEAIEAAQSDFINFGLPAAESESLRIDAAIDTAMKGEQ